MKGPVARIPDCHPDRKHCAKGMCRPCYYAQPEMIAKRTAYHSTPKAKARRLQLNSTPEWRESRKAYRALERTREIEKASRSTPARRLSHKRAKWRHWLKSQYGITPERYDDMIRASQGRCYICAAACPSIKALAVDHCHTTGRVRGILCWNCNRAIGLFQDSPEFLRAAAAYLEPPGITRVA
jgi:methylphosphotriester-DNA--protein-cysteine methyltransferase